MKIYEYVTSKGTKIKLNIINSKQIVIETKEKKMNSKGYITYDYSKKFPILGLVTDEKINDKRIVVEITKEIEEYLRLLREKEEIRKLPYKEKLEKIIKQLKYKINFLEFVDADMITGLKYYKLKNKLDLDVWNKVKHLFEYINTAQHNDEFDSMFESHYKGYATIYPDKVEKILRTIYKDKIVRIEKNIEKFKMRLEKYNKEIEKEKKRQKEILKSKFMQLYQKYPMFEREIKELFNKYRDKFNYQNIKDNNLTFKNLLDVFSEEKKEYPLAGKIEETYKIISDYEDNKTNNHYFFQKENETNLIVFNKNSVFYIKPTKYRWEYWNSGDKESLMNGYFTPIGFCYFEEYKVKNIDKFRELLKEFGIKKNTYRENSFYAILDKTKNENYIEEFEFPHFVALSEDYNYCKNNNEVLNKYLRDTNCKLENIIKVTQFKTFNKTEKIKFLKNSDVYNNFIKFIDKQAPSDKEEYQKWLDNNPYSDEKFEEWVKENYTEDELKKEIEKLNQNNLNNNKINVRPKK